MLTSEAHLLKVIYALSKLESEDIAADSFRDAIAEFKSRHVHHSNRFHQLHGGLAPQRLPILNSFFVGPARPPEMNKCGFVSRSATKEMLSNASFVGSARPPPSSTRGYLHHFESIFDRLLRLLLMSKINSSYISFP